MSSEFSPDWLKNPNFSGPARRFAEFCASELERRSSEDDFDPEIFDEAVKLVLRKLGALDLEDMQ